jgi:hypothetical protein
MNTAYRWVILFLLLCSVPAAAEGPRELKRRNPERAKPVIVDGVLYDRGELEQFKSRPMYWVVESDAVHGFTTPEGVQAYGREHGKIGERPVGLQPFTKASSSCSSFNKNVGCGGIDWLILCPLNQNAHLPDSWNDVISCVDAGSDVGYYTVLYKCYYFSYDPPDTCLYHILWVAPGNTITDLNAYAMNNITSSIRFCSNIDPYSCSQ